MASSELPQAQGRTAMAIALHALCLRAPAGARAWFGWVKDWRGELMPRARESLTTMMVRRMPRDGRKPFAFLQNLAQLACALQTLFEGFNPKVRARSDPQHFRALFFLRAARRAGRHSGVREGGVARRTARPWRRARAGRGRTDPGREGGACGERRRRRTTHHAPPPRAVRRAQWVAKKRGGRLPRPSPSGGRALPRASVRRS